MTMGGLYEKYYNEGPARERICPMATSSVVGCLRIVGGEGRQRYEVEKFQLKYLAPGDPRLHDASNRKLQQNI